MFQQFHHHHERRSIDRQPTPGPAAELFFVCFTVVAIVATVAVFFNS